MNHLACQQTNVNWSCVTLEINAVSSLRGWRVFLKLLKIKQKLSWQRDSHNCSSCTRATISCFFGLNKFYVHADCKLFLCHDSFLSRWVIKYWISLRGLSLSDLLSVVDYENVFVRAQINVGFCGDSLQKSFQTAKFQFVDTEMIHRRKIVLVAGFVIVFLIIRLRNMENSFRGN